MKKGAIVVSVALAAALGLAGCNSGSNSSGAQGQIVFENNGTKYYNSGALVIKLDGTDTPTYVHINNIDEYGSGLYRSDYFYQYENTGVRAGNIFYQADPKLSKVTRSELSGDSVNRSILYDTGAWIPAVKEKLNGKDNYTEDDYAAMSDDIMSYTRNSIDGGDGYVYFYYVAPREYYNYWLDLNYTLCRYAKDGSGMEFLDGSVRPGALTGQDGYIYFYDTGFNTGSGDNMSVDEVRMGIYKMKPDGSEKEKLVSFTGLTEEEKNELVYASFEGKCARLEIYKNDLYYILSESEDESFLYKVPLSGGQPEKVVEGSVANYYIDPASDTLYCQDGKLGRIGPDGCVIYSRPLAGGSETKLYHKGNAPSYNDWACVDGDYLYIFNSNYFVTFQAVQDGEDYYGSVMSGQRFNLKTKEMEELQCVQKVKEETDASGEPVYLTDGDPDIKWVRSESRDAEDGLKYYI